LSDAHRAIGFALGGEAGSRLAEHLDMPTSPDTPSASRQEPTGRIVPSAALPRRG
jgi:hypothetical protein